MSSKSIPSLFVLSIAAITVSAWGQPAIDQEQPAVDTSVGGLAVTDAPHSEQKLAQVFVPGRDGRLTHVTVPIGCDPFSSFTLEVVKVAGGLPTATVLTSETVSGSVFPSGPPSFGDVGFRIIELRAPIQILAGVEYAIVLSAKGDCGIFQSPPVDTYAGGRAYFDARPNPPGWLALGDFDGRDDLPFQIFTDQCRGRVPSSRCSP